MISRIYRFHGYSALLPVYRRGTTVRGSLLNLKFAPRKAGQSYRAAVVVSKKVHKSAVVRNRIRRRVFEIIRAEQANLPAADIVVTIFSDQVASLPAAQLQEQVRGLLAKINSTTPDATTGNHGIVNTKRN
ncbi:MAG: ribonuclease P protein component [Patescibacteria group bacterium]|nr:ribonuclease P protein component [Patescibacteria group bacterium]